MVFGGRRYRVEWGHLLVVTLILAATIVYLFDARAVSLSIDNLLLVQPAAICAFLLYLMIIPQCVHRLPPGNKAAAGNGEVATVRQRVELLKVGALAVAMGLFVFSLEIIGFDVSTLLFTAIGLFICGERRPVWLTVYPLVFTVMVVFGYQQLLPYPIFTLVL